MGTVSDNTRIAKNTVYLYVRMLFTMAVSLYTSRVVLSALGVEDYGIYNVVGGLVAMFTILSNSLSAAISRFVTFELGKGNSEELNKVFCTSLNVQFILIFFITILLETAGLWFLNQKMIIPEHRLVAANWVFQFSVISFAVNLWSVPYNASIIAHERMSAFAYISIFDAVAKLVVALAVQCYMADRLVLYGALILAVGFLQRYIYAVYCKKNFSECRYTFSYDRITMKKMFGFAGWNFIGASSAVLRDQGGNMLINLFFGPSVNAARGIAMSVNSAVTGFVSNFMTAINPQITKSYAAGEHDKMFKLVFQGARLSYYILLVLALPVIFTSQYLLELWLGIVPDHAACFARLVLIFTMSESLAAPLITVMLATGDIRNYQIVVGGLQLLNIPVSYAFLYFGYPPEIIFIVAITISVASEMLRLLMLKKLINFSVKGFLKDVYLNVVVVTVFAAIVPSLVIRNISIDNFTSFLLVVSISVLSAMTSIYYLGCNKNDRYFIHKAFAKIFLRFR